jgi:hypothetical protein
MLLTSYSLSKDTRERVEKVEKLALLDSGNVDRKTVVSAAT